jgi:hypothetical protein
LKSKAFDDYTQLGDQILEIMNGELEAGQFAGDAAPAEAAR